MTAAVFFVDSMPPEVGAAALLCSLDGRIHARPYSIAGARNLAGASLDGVTHALFLGTYWDAEFISALVERKSVKVLFGSLDGSTPVDAALRFASLFREDAAGAEPRADDDDGCAEAPSAATYDGMIEWLRKRCETPVSDESQRVFSGLLTHPALAAEKTLFDRFLAFFTRKIPFSELAELGESVFRAHLQLVTERVQANSGEVVLASGMRIAVTNAPDLVNLSHRALKAANPSIDGSLTVAVRFNKQAQTTELSLSVRSYNTHFDAKKFVSQQVADQQHGDGSPISAGGRVEIVLPLKYSE